jgi:hypothetical protein
MMSKRPRHESRRNLNNFDQTRNKAPELCPAELRKLRNAITVWSLPALEAICNVHVIRLSMLSHEYTAVSELRRFNVKSSSIATSVNVTTTLSTKYEITVGTPAQSNSPPSWPPMWTSDSPAEPGPAAMDKSTRGLQS